MGDECVFCEIVAGRAPAEVVARGANDLIIVPLSPVVPGHVIVIPHQHVTDVTDDPMVSGACFRAAAWFTKNNGPLSFNLITSVGAPATQTVGHLHVHIVPRNKGDGVALPWTAQQTAAALADANTTLHAQRQSGVYWQGRALEATAEIEALRATLAATTDERDLWRAEWEGITATAHELAATLATERAEGERREQLIEAQAAYIGLLGEECKRAARIGVTHPHLAPPQASIDRGAELRAQIAALSPRLTGR